MQRVRVDVLQLLLKIVFEKRVSIFVAFEDYKYN